MFNPLEQHDCNAVTILSCELGNLKCRYYDVYMPLQCIYQTEILHTQFDSFWLSYYGA